MKKFKMPFWLIISIGLLIPTRIILHYLNCNSPTGCEANVTLLLLGLAIAITGVFTSCKALIIGIGNLTDKIKQKDE